MPIKTERRSVKALSDFTKLPVCEREKVSSKMKEIFRQADANGDGYLSLDELKTTLRSLSDWSEEQFKQLFEKADVNADGKLDVGEFIDWVLDTGAPEILEPALQKTVDTDKSITYPNGVVVSLDHCKVSMKEYLDQLTHADSVVNLADLEGLLKLNHKEYCKQMHQFFVEADANVSGALSWNDKEIYKFFILVFEKLGLPMPFGGDYVFHGVYTQFDTDQSSSLSEAECLYMIDSVLRVIQRCCPKKTTSRKPPK